VLPGERGDAVLLLRGGARVPCSRPHRAAVQAALAGLTAPTRPSDSGA
jgi:hypothetical protein